MRFALASVCLLLLSGCVSSSDDAPDASDSRNLETIDVSNASALYVFDGPVEYNVEVPFPEVGESPKACLVFGTGSDTFLTDGSGYFVGASTGTTDVRAHALPVEGSRFGSAGYTSAFFIANQGIDATATVRADPTTITVVPLDFSCVGDPASLGGTWVGNSFVGQNLRWASEAGTGLQWAFLSGDRARVTSSHGSMDAPGGGFWSVLDNESFEIHVHDFVATSNPRMIFATLHGMSLDQATQFFDRNVDHP
ncbi:MAG: hypothetical protein ACPHK8_00605 [Thermoplasmatota archaeon]